MGPTRYLIAVGVAVLLGGLAPAGASVVANSDGVAARLDTFTAADGQAAAAAACAGSQCGLLEQKSAARALATAAGAGVGQPMDRPSIIPDKVRTAANSSSEEEPILFTVITPSRLGRSQLCVEEGNLLGLDPTCARPRQTADVGSSIDCPNGSGYDRHGRLCSPPSDDNPCLNEPGLNRHGILCRPPDQAPEPGTLVLLVMAFLALAAARVRHKASPARL